MARDGITKLQVQQVRIALIAQGRHPSVEAVRAELGTGSNTTILKYLKELGEDEKGRLDDLGALSDELGQLLTSSPTFALRVSGGGFPLLGDSCSRSTWFLLHRAA